MCLPPKRKLTYLRDKQYTISGRIGGRDLRSRQILVLIPAKLGGRHGCVACTLEPL
jgi:hypothetical protein